MNDKELADKVVALGVGELHLPFLGIDTYGWYGERLAPDQFVRDWRVAGALLEKVKDKPLFIEGGDCIIHIGYTDNGEGISVVGKNESLPCAIIEACVEALEEE